MGYPNDNEESHRYGLSGEILAGECEEGRRAGTSEAAEPLMIGEVH